MGRRNVKYITQSIVVAILLFTPCIMHAEGKLLRDTVISSSRQIIQERDTIAPTAMPEGYKALKEQSSKRRWTKRLYAFIVRDIKEPKEPEAEKGDIYDCSEYEGKIIRKINIRVLSPFGTNVEAPDYEEKEFKFLNNVHSKTRASTIRNIIQFKKGSPLNPVLITTSEAELRNTTYISDARIRVDGLSHTSDSVDVDIVVRDKWTIGGELHTITTSKADFEIFDKNILGTGSRIGLDFLYSTEYSRKVGAGINYLYRNIARTDINLEGSYMDRISEQESSVSLYRTPRPTVKYYGELTFSKKVQSPDRIDWDSISPERNEQYSATIGRAFTLSEEKTIRRLALSVRYRRKEPEYRSGIYKDHLKDVLLPYEYIPSQIWLAKLSLFENSYQREQMVYNFGNTEDIPQGYNLSMSFGYSDFRHIKDGFYGSLEAAYGSSKLLRGHVYVKSSISSFFDKSESYGGIYKIDARYFSPLRRFFNWRFRQFFTISYSKLLHPDRYLGDRIYMGEHTTLKMREWRDGTSGFEQLLFRSETDLFSNYEVAGFRCLLYGFFDTGLITENRDLFKSENFNYGYGVGVRLRNNFIVFNTIDLKIGVYPKLEQSGFRSFFKVHSSTPDVPPNFIPSIPKEELLE